MGAPPCASRILPMTSCDPATCAATMRLFGLAQPTAKAVSQRRRMRIEALSGIRGAVPRGGGADRSRDGWSHLRTIRPRRRSEADGTNLAAHPLMEGLRQDLRGALRVLTRSPGFAAVV